MLEVKIESFSYDTKEILRDISFSLQQGEHLSVLGESGGGKSTLLHLIYGLLQLKHGELRWKDKLLLGPEFNLIPGEPFMKLVAQEFNVMPFITVAENLSTYLGREDMTASEERVDELLEVVQLQDKKDVMVKNLSGGQKQRVALAKALALEPELLLLDEPFSHIDTFRKNSLRRKLFSYLKSKNISCITATHDSDVALAFSDRILILNQGSVEILGSPPAVYENLKSVYQGSFFGDVNEIQSSLLDNGGSDKVIFLLPHQLKVSKAKTPLQVEVCSNYFMGPNFLVEGLKDGKKVFFVSSDKLKTSSKVYLTTNLN